MTIYLYIKQHSKTGLKYFGRTEKSNPWIYLGSGRYWKNHIKKYGKEFVETLAVFEFTNQTDCTNFALSFSTKNNIVESKEWANQCLEDGLWQGGSKGMKQSPESNLKRSKSLQGHKPGRSWNKGLTKNDHPSIAKHAETMAGRIGGTKGHRKETHTYLRLKSEKMKGRPSHRKGLPSPLRGRAMQEEHKEKRRKIKIFVKSGIQYKFTSLSEIKEFALLNNLSYWGFHRLIYGCPNSEYEGYRYMQELSNQKKC